jgi:hypothetical protein
MYWYSYQRAPKKFKVANKMNDYREFIAYLASLKYPCHIGLEATANYQLTDCMLFTNIGFYVYFVSSLAAARTREALHNSWYPQQTSLPNLPASTSSNILNNLCF